MRAELLTSPEIIPLDIRTGGPPLFRAHLWRTATPGRVPDLRFLLISIASASETPFASWVGFRVLVNFFFPEVKRG